MRDVIREVRPDIIMVELDDERLGVLVDFGEQQVPIHTFPPVDGHVDRR